MFGSRGAGINPCICSLWVGDGTISVSGPHWCLRWWLGTGPSCTQQKTQLTELSRFPPAILHQILFSQRLKVLLNIGFFSWAPSPAWVDTKAAVCALLGGISESSVATPVAMSCFSVVQHNTNRQCWSSPAFYFLLLVYSLPLWG